MKNRKKVRIKIVELTPPKNSKRGRIKYNGKEPLPHEKKTIKCLSKYGFDVETIIPSNMPGSHNPDILMMGTFWEMKGPTSINKNTIKNRFEKAKKQADGRAIFDLRNIKYGTTKTKYDIIELFTTTRGMRRILVVEKGDKILDITK